MDEKSCANFFPKNWISQHLFWSESHRGSQHIVTFNGSEWIYMQPLCTVEHCGLCEDHFYSSCCIWSQCSDRFEDKLLGEGVLGFGHLFESLVNATAHFPVDPCQDTENIIHVWSIRENDNIRKTNELTNKENNLISKTVFIFCDRNSKSHLMWCTKKLV